jgi:hypothetical protein
MTTQNIKEELNKDMENLRERIKQKSWKQKVPLVKERKHSGSPLQQTRANGRQNLRAQR